MKAELITVDTDVLLGNIVDHNGSLLSRLCHMAEIELVGIRVITEDRSHLKKVIADSLNEADLILVACGNKTNGNYDYIERVREELISLFSEKEQKRIILFPGNPDGIESVFQHEVMPNVKNRNRNHLVTQTVRLCGIDARKAETMIADLLVQQRDPQLTVRYAVGEIQIHLITQTIDEKDGRKKIKSVVKELKKRFGDCLVSAKKDVSLEQAVANLLEDNDYTITTAESCTGGLIAGRLLNVTGASKILHSAFVTYSNKSKHKLIGVKKTTMQKYTSVSAAVAREMAKGAAKEAKADVALSATGVVDPEDVSAEYPMGLVYIGCYVCGRSFVEKHYFEGTGQRLRENIVVAALTFARKCIREQAKAK